MVSKVSEITIKDVAEYIKDYDVEDSVLETYLNIAKAYISSYTGIHEEDEYEDEEETLDSYSDFVIVVYILCQDMHDNRCLYINSANVNKVVQTILDMHCKNYL